MASPEGELVYYAATRIPGTESRLTSDSAGEGQLSQQESAGHRSFGPHPQTKKKIGFGGPHNAIHQEET
jgi:hypothetical protein